METSRRGLGSVIALGGAGIVLAPAAAAAVPADARLVHHVLFWLNNAGSAADRDALIAGLRTLAAIPTVRSLHIGVPAPTEARDVVDASYDVSEMLTFASAADQKAYQDHEIHEVFVARCAHLWRRVTVYDVMTI